MLDSDSLAAARSHSGSDSRPRLSFIALVPLRYVQGCHSLPSPFESLFAKKEKSAESALFLFGLPWGIRTPNRQNRNLILYPIALRADEIPCGILSFF